MTKEKHLFLCSPLSNTVNGHEDLLWNTWGHSLPSWWDLGSDTRPFGVYRVCVFPVPPQQVKNKHQRILSRDCYTIDSFAYPWCLLLTLGPGVHIPSPVPVPHPPPPWSRDDEPQSHRWSSVGFTQLFV